MFLLLAFLCFLAAGIWSAVVRAWPTVLLCAGLAFWVLASGPLTIG
jgi:hypothetical protein